MNSTKASFDLTRPSIPAKVFRGVLGRDIGTAVLELALLAPVFLLLTLGAVEFARVTYAWIEVTNAARAGIAFGSQNHITAANAVGVQQAAANEAADISGVTVTSTSYCICANGAASGCAPTDCSGSRIIEYLQVNTSVTVNPLVHYWNPQKTSFTLSGIAVARVKN